MKSVAGGRKTGGGGGHANSVLDWGGAMQIPYWIGGGQVNSALDLGGSCKFRIRGKKPATLHFRIIIYLLNNQINYFIYSIRYFSVSVQYSTGTPFRYCIEGGEG